MDDGRAGQVGTVPHRHRRVSTDGRGADPGRCGRAVGRLVRPGSWPIAAPFLLLWALSPLIARWVSRPPRADPTQGLSPPDARLLRSTARRTWRFFEAFVGPDDTFLPPDNFQEDPKPVLAHRTSPTNIGLYLGATVAARDLGWLGMLETVDRLEATLATMGRLERFRGHFYNWYDTTDLRPLEPRYVSTVDSGNLASQLLVLGNACRAALDRPLLDHEAFAGIEDAVLLVREAANALVDDRRTQTVRLGHLDQACEACPRRSATRPERRQTGSSGSVSSPARPMRWWTSRAR